MLGKIYSESLTVLRKNLFLTALVVISSGFVIVLRKPLDILPALVDWNTIITLSGLLLITTGIKESGLFSLLAYRISRQIDNERLLALFLIFISATLAMFLTNDIALFIIIPLTLSLQEISNADYRKVIIYEAIAVNVGSSLTPIGNPQNIFLWHQWGVSFPVFVKEMTPLVLMMSAWLFIMVFLSFSPAKVNIANHQPPAVRRGLFYLSTVLLIAFIVSVELQYEKYFFLIIIASLLLTYKKVIFKADWGLILLFIFVFIDLHLVSQLNTIQRLLALLNFNNTHTLLLSGALFSQAISNIPSAILLADYSSDFKIIAYAVNLGGNGLLIGSFANLIALRFMKRRSEYLLFHVYSVPYFIITLVLAYYLLI